MDDNTSVMIDAFSSGMSSVFQSPSVRLVLCLVGGLFLLRLALRIILFFRGGGGH